MTEPETAPMADEPHPDEPSGDTSGTSAPQSTPPRADPFKKGYGSGIAKGRKEGAMKREEEILAALGYTSIDEAMAERESRTSEDDRRSAQAEIQVKRMQRELQQRDAEMARLATMADQARLDRLKAAALERGIGRGKQLDYFVAMHGASVRWNGDNALEVVARENGEAIPTGQSLDEWLDEVIAETPFLTAPRSTPGAGSRIEPASGPGPKPNDLFGILGVKRG